MSGFGEYECALTGVTSLGGDFEEEDGLDDLPLGWIEVRMARRALNPEWMMLQQIMEASRQQLMAQLPPEGNREEQEMFVNYQVKLAYDQAQKMTPKYVKDVDDVFYLSPEGEVISALNEVRESFGLEPVEPPTDVEEDDTDEDE